MLGGAAPVAFVVSGEWYSSMRDVHLLDMTDRLRPRFAGSLEITGAVVALEPRGDRLFLATNSRLSVVDFGDWNAPYILNSERLPEGCMDFALADDLAWIINRRGGIELYSATDRVSPRARYSGISCQRIVAEDKHAFVRKISSGSVQRIGISPNGALVPGVTIVQSSADIALSDARLYVLDSRRVRVFDAAHADTFPLIAEFAVPSGMGRMRVQNHTMILKGDGLVLLDVTDPAAPEPLSRLPRLTAEVALSDDWAVVLDRHDQLVVTDGMRKPMVVPLASTFEPGDCRKIAVENGRAYVVDAQRQLSVMDVSQPTSTPVSLGRTQVAHTVLSLEEDASRLYICEGLKGAEILDVTDPAAMTKIGTIPGNVWGVHVDGAIAYVASDRDGIRVFDVSDEGAPLLMGGATVGGRAWDIAMQGSIAFLACLTDGLSVVDVSDPTSPRLIATLPTPGSVFGVSVFEGTVCATTSRGWVFIDADVPTQPRIAASLEAQVHASEARMDRNLAYLADRETGIKVVDVSDPSAPTPFGSAWSSGQVLGLAVDGGRIYVADGRSGLVVFPAQR